MALLLRIGVFFLVLGFARIADTFFSAPSNRNQPPRAEEVEEKLRIAIACVISFVHGREFRMTHAAILHVTNTRSTTSSLRGPCFITFPPHVFNSLASRLVASPERLPGV